MAANTLVEVPHWILFVRLAQFIVSFLVLLFTIIPIALWGGYYSFGLGIFTCLATFVITGYWYWSNKRNQSIYNRWAILALDCWSVLWWLISFATLAELAAAFNVIAGAYDLVDEVDGETTVSHNLDASRALTGLAAFLGAVEFVLFLVTLITFSMRLHKQRQTEFRPMYANANLQPYPNNQQQYPNNGYQNGSMNGSMNGAAKEVPYVSQQPVQNFNHV